MGGEIDQFSTAVKIADNLSLIAVLVFFLWYFIKREGKREDFIAQVVSKNTSAINRQTIAVLKIAEIVEQSQPNTSREARENIRKIINNVEEQIKEDV